MDESVGHKTRNEEKYVERKESVTMGYTLPSVPWSCKGCPVVSWRSWLGDKVNLLPWNCRVTGVSGWEIRFWLPAMLASWAIFTTSPPLTEKKKTLTQIALKSIFMVPKQYTELVKGWRKKKTRHAEPGWINQWNEHSSSLQQKGKKMPKDSPQVRQGAWNSKVTN